MGTAALMDKRRAERAAVVNHRQPAPPSSGVGTELKRILNWMSLGASSGCACKEHARVMDANGSAWCKSNLGLICLWLWQEKEKRHLWSLRIAWDVFRAIVKQTVAYLGKTPLVRLFVRLAWDLDQIVFMFASRGVVRLAIYLARSRNGDS